MIDYNSVAVLRTKVINILINQTFAVEFQWLDNYYVVNSAHIETGRKEK